MMKKILSCVFVTAFLVVFASMAMAGTLLVSGSDTPGSYSLSGPEGGTTPVAVSLPASPWAKGSWMAPSTDQIWDPSVSHGNKEGTYTYTTTFNLTGLNPLTAVLNGTWAADNSVTAWLNGAPVASLPDNSASFTTLNALSITSGFKPGKNTLSFKVVNDPQLYGGSIQPNPTGLL
ncbi:MAG: hypothetical protein L7F78_21195, partial [Syntrophales bacterium LBB04]|nr:hypothetical protein [Syntrophales bacterium LBB04]